MKERDDLNEVGDLVSRLADELESTDILIQINAVEMFADGASQLVLHLPRRNVNLRLRKPSNHSCCLYRI